jgi:hypothetical protein
MSSINPVDVWGSAFHLLDRRSIQDWAADKVTMPPVITRQGKFSVEHSRHFIAPLDALRSDRVRAVLIAKPVRGGGTLIADVAIPWAIDNDHAAILMVFQDAKIAEAHAETRTTPILESVSSIQAMLSSDHNKTRKTNILFANGLPLILTGPAVGNLQSRGFKWVICDEAWLYKPGVLGQAKGRLGDYVKMSSSKFLVISQGGEEEGDWDLEFRSGVLFVWNVPCAGCGAFVAPEWTLRKADGEFAGAVFDTVKHLDGTYDKEASAATVRFVCPKCGHAHPNTQKTLAAWNAGGKYLNAKTGAEFDPANPPSEVSFRWHALIDYPWAELVKEWLAAQEAKHVGNFAPMVNFFQKRCAQMRSERTVHETDVPFARAPIARPDPKDKTWALCLTADRQSEDLYWVAVRAWAMTGESRRIWFGRVYGEAAVEAKRVECGVNADCTLVDSGYLPKGDHGVYAACIRYGWIALKGTEEPFFWHSVPARVPGAMPQRVQRPWAPLSYGDPGEGTGAQGKRQCKLVRFAAGVMADRVSGLIERGLWVEPTFDPADQAAAEVEREYSVQMSAEFKRPKVNKFTGKREMVWVCPSGNNHAFDCAKMQVLFAMLTGRLPAGIELETTSQEQKT